LGPSLGEAASSCEASGRWVQAVSDNSCSMIGRPREAAGQGRRRRRRLMGDGRSPGSKVLNASRTLSGLSFSRFTITTICGPGPAA
jgi:hypothetical protein